MTDEEVRAFLAERMVMHVRDERAARLAAPDAALVHAATDAHELDLREVAEGANLERDPRATLQVEDGVQYHELRGVMLECDVAIERDPEKVASSSGWTLFERYAGELADEVSAMVAQQAPKRVGLTFVPTRTVSWDHRKLGGATDD